MNITKVLEILGKHIIRIEEDNQFKDWEIEKLNKKLKDIEEHIEKYEK